MRILINGIFVITLSSSIYGQSNSEIAKAYYFEAEGSYKEGNYDNALEKLNRSVEYLGESNPSIELLRVKCYFDKGNYEKAKTYLAKFYDFNPGDKLQKMAAPLIVQIDEKLEEQKRKEEERRRKEEELRQRELKIENDRWQHVRTATDPMPLTDFIKDYPNGRFTSEALMLIEKLKEDRTRRFEEISNSFKGTFKISTHENAIIQFLPSSSHSGFFAIHKPVTWPSFVLFLANGYATGSLPKTEHFELSVNTENETFKVKEIGEYKPSNYFNDEDALKYVPLDLLVEGGYNLDEFRYGSRGDRYFGYLHYGTYSIDPENRKISLNEQYRVCSYPVWSYKTERVKRFKENGLRVSYYRIKEKNKLWRQEYSDKKEIYSPVEFLFNKKTLLLDWEGSDKYIPEIPKSFSVGYQTKYFEWVKYGLNHVDDRVTFGGNTINELGKDEIIDSFREKVWYKAKF